MTASLTCKRPAFGALLSETFEKQRPKSAGILVQSPRPVSRKTAAITWTPWVGRRQGSSRKRIYPASNRRDAARTPPREGLTQSCDAFSARREKPEYRGRGFSCAMYCG